MKTPAPHFFLALLLACSLLPFYAYGDQGVERGSYRGHYGPQIGDVVWTDTGLEGRVEAVFPNGTLSVKIGYSNYTFRSEQLAQRGCFRRLCSGAGVITQTGLNGKINGVFPSGLFSVKIGYANYAFRFDQLASGQPRPPHAPGLRVGDTVWTDTGLQGQVVGLFPNGEVSVKISYANYKFTRQQLAIQGCVHDLCSGDPVVTTTGLKGTVNGVFLGTRLSVKISYAHYAFDYSQLARTR